MEAEKIEEEIETENTFSIFRDLLGVITPEEAERLTTVTSSESRGLLTDFISETLECYDSGNSGKKGTAQILPFGKNKSNEDSAESNDSNEEQEVAGAGAIRKDKEEEIEENQELNNELQEVDPADNTNDFLLSMQAKLKSSQDKLKSKEVYKLYTENATVDLTSQKIDKDDLSKSSDSGVLVNKKQL